MAPLCEAISATYTGRDEQNRAVYKGEVDPLWTVITVPQGGYVLGLIIESAIAHQAGTAHPDPIHVTAHFLRSAAPGSFEVRVRDLKTGRDFKHVSAVLIQNNEERITTHMIFGTLDAPPPVGRASLALTPASPYGAHTPMHTHPSRCPDKPTFKQARWKYAELLQIQPDPVFVEQRRTPQRGLQWGEYVGMNDDREQLTPASMAFFADCFASYPAHLPALTDHRIWLPTMVMTLEFKAPVPRLDEAHVAPRRVAVYTQSKFVNEPAGRHDAYVEVWTAPPDGVDIDGDEWKKHQRCLVVSSQMALVVPASVNHKSGAKGKL